MKLYFQLLEKKFLKSKTNFKNSIKYLSNVEITQSIYDGKKECILWLNILKINVIRKVFNNNNYNNNI